MGYAIIYCFTAANNKKLTCNSASVNSVLDDKSWRTSGFSLLFGLPIPTYAAAKMLDCLRGDSVFDF